MTGAEYVPSYLLTSGEDDPRAPSAAHPVTIAAPWKPFLPHQWQHYKFLPPASDKPQVATEAILGGWGSGKTHENLRKAIRMAQLNPWRSCYGNGNPRGILAAPTHRILRQSVLFHFDQLVPREMVMQRRGPPHNDILMSNGFRWILHSGESEIEGLDAAVVLVTEIHHPSWSAEPTKFLNLMARLRDPHAQYMAMLVDGLPESGWVRDTFDLENRPNPTRQTVLAKTADNPYIPQATLQAFYDSCPSGQEKKLLGGQWMPPIGAIYPQFSADVHLIEMRGHENVVTHLGMDVGNFGAVIMAQEIDVELRNIVGQKRTDKGLLICDQMLTVDESVDRQCYRIKTETKWHVGQGSTIAVDPTIRRDELHAIRNHFPDAKIVKRERGHTHFPIEAGIRSVQRAFCDALGNVRLYISRHLANTPNGVVDAIQRYRRNEKTQEPIKDNARDHCADSLRYIVTEQLQPERPETVVFS